MFNKKLFVTATVALTFALSATSSFALCSVDWARVHDTVSQVNSSSYQYDYSLTGTSGSCTSFHKMKVVAFSVPYFVDAHISNIAAPNGWSANVNAADTFQLGHGAETLTWTAAPGFEILGSTPAVTVGGFSYTAAYAPAYGPFSYFDGFYLRFGDPALPGSPNGIAAGFAPIAAVPEPSSLQMMLAALLLFGFAAWQRRKS